MTARRRVARGAAVGGAALVAGVGVGVALAGSGGLDPSFGTGGATILSNPTETFPAQAASAANGKTVLVSTASGQVTVTRLQQDGSPDPTFDTDGQATLSTSGATLTGSAVAVLGDGRIVVVGTTDNGTTSDVIMWRLKAEGGPGAANGALDPTFDTDGIAGLDSNLHDRGLALAIRPDGKIVVAGTTFGMSGPVRLVVWRVQANGGPGTVNGALDPSFDTDGVTDINDGGNNEPKAVALRSDGKIVIAGDTDAGGTLDAAVWRLKADGGPATPNGALDTSFDTDGLATAANGGTERANGLALQPDNKVVIAGSTSNGPGGGDALVWRMQADGGPGTVNGALDPSFDADGVAVIDGGGFETASGLALQPDGKLIVGGTQQLPAKPFAAMVWRMTANGGPGAVNGALDPTFGTGGAASFDAGTGAAANALTLQADRRIVAAGKTSVGQTLLAFRVLGDPFSVNVARAGTGVGTVQSSPAGIDCTGACSGAFDDGSRVTLTATAASGSTFAGWSGAGCGGTDACGLTMNADQTVTATFTPGTPPGSNPGAALPVRAAILALSQTHPIFRVGTRSTPLTGQATRTHPRGTTFSLRLDRPATITVRIQRQLPGRRVGRVCRRPTRPLRNRPRCTRLVTKVTLRRTGRAGRNRIAFSGRIRGRALPPGRYRAAFGAANAAGTSPLRALGFRIVAR